MTNNFDLGRVALNVARVFRPEAFVLPTSRFERRPKILTSKEVSYIYPTPNGPLVGRYSAPVTTFLIETPKRLEIAVTHTKKSTEVTSNRDKLHPLRRRIYPGFYVLTTLESPKRRPCGLVRSGNQLCKKRQFVIGRVIKSERKLWTFLGRICP
jgi:hypothetical protein